MAYKVNFNGYDIECDSADDLLALLSKNGDKAPKVPDAQQRATVAGRSATPMAELITKLRKEQRDLLRMISVNGPIARESLLKMAGSPGHHEFAGLLIGITKSAAGTGIESPIEKLTERINGRGPRVYQYKIKDDVKAEVKEALSK
jgi:hypothetical protein